jgi:hypothetical protein
MDDNDTYPGVVPQNEIWSGPPCPHCGSRDIVSGLKFNLNAEVGPLGLSYKAVAFLRGTEQLYAELCRGCGTVTRTYVKNTQRNWIQK